LTKTDADDLFEMYKSDVGADTALKGEALALALTDTVRNVFATMEGLVQEVEQALAKARYIIRVDSAVTDRSSYVRLDRKSESFRDYLRNWGQQRARSGGAMHWEGRIIVTDVRRENAEIGLGIAVDWPDEGSKPSGAFIEFWTTGQGVSLPQEGRAFQRALVSSIVRLEQKGALKAASQR
jgi:hypothetical protein